MRPVPPYPAQAPALHLVDLPSAFRRLAWSGLCSTGADQVVVAAAPLAAVLLFAAGPAEIGWLQTVQTLPFLLFAIPAGLVADRLSRRNLLIGAETLRFVSLMSVVVLAGLGVLGLQTLALLGFFAALGTVCYFVAVPAMVPQLVPRSTLSEANRWLELARSFAYTLGPVLAGSAIQWAGAPSAYALASALALAGLVTLTRLPRDAKTEAPRRRPLLELRQAADFVAGHRLLRPIFITAVVFNAAWFVLQAVFVAYALGDLGMSARAVGITLGLSGVGMVAGAVLAPALSRRLAFGTIVVLGPLAGFLAATLVLLTAWLPVPALAGLGFLLFGLGPILWTISTTTLRQVATPNAMLGRVSALLVTATFGARPVGAAIGAGLAALAGPTACLSVAACGFLVQLAVIWLSDVRSLRTLPEAA
ncbi:MAG: MFS transporter [Trueperaceae bacterium]|nr:MFS transporter [Trueperaceae bacterium]